MRRHHLQFERHGANKQRRSLTSFTVNKTNTVMLRSSTKSFLFCSQGRLLFFDGNIPWHNSNYLFSSRFPSRINSELIFYIIHYIVFLFVSPLFSSLLLSSSFLPSQEELEAESSIHNANRLRQPHTFLIQCVWCCGGEMLHLAQCEMQIQHPGPEPQEFTGGLEKNIRCARQFYKCALW